MSTTASSVHRQRRTYLRYVFSDALAQDSRAIPYLVNKHTRIAASDTGYRSALHKKLHKLWGTIFVVPQHYKQKKQMATKSQMKTVETQAQD